MFECLEKNGYQLFSGYIPTQKIEKVKNSIMCCFNQQLRLLGQVEEIDLDLSMRKLFSLDLERYKATVSSLWRLLDVSELCQSKEVISLVKQIFSSENLFLPGGQVVHIQSKSLKIPEGYFGLSAHQDYRSVQGSLDGIVVWIPLVDIDEKRYPVEVVKASHLSGLYTLAENNQMPWDIDPAILSTFNFEKLTCKAGDIVVFSNFLVHRSAIDGDDRIRVACSTRYDNGENYDFIRRTYYSAYRRSVERELDPRLDLEKLEAK